jgi:hypothetical protein
MGYVDPRCKAVEHDSVERWVLVCLVRFSNHIDALDVGR